MEKIFGTPQEPLFNNKCNGMSPEMLQEWLVTLAVTNSQQIATTQVNHQGLFMCSNVVEFIFLTCEKLRLASHVKYIAVDIFNRFMFKYIEDLYSHILETSTTKKKKEWQGIQNHIKAHIMLRILSCCQITSKLTSHYKVVSAARVRKYLSDLGHRYTPDSILRSELRILKTLDFNVMDPSSVVYLETILEILGHNDPDTEVKVFYSVALRVLDLVYLQYHPTYNLLFKITTNKSPSHVEKKAFNQLVRSDKLLLATAVIAAAVYIVEQSNTDKVILHLNKITRIPKDDIIDFATVLIQIVDEKKTPY